MIRIVFICSLISIARSEECSLNGVELQRLRIGFSEASAYMQNQDKSNAVVCIGTARAGKSTLINYLMGNKLKAVRPTRTSKLIIELADNTTVGPEIGAGTLSKTTMPSKWNSNLLPDLVIWDSPGFNDNRGTVQDITNAFYLYELLKIVDSLKFVLVINFQDIMNDNIEPFLILLENLENFLGKSFKKYFPSITIIFSKAPFMEEDIKVDNQYINEKLKDQVLSNVKLAMSETCRDFVEYITTNNDRIGFFRRANTTGDINSDIDDNIVQAIKNSSFIRKEYVKDIHPSISQLSKICLHSSRKRLLTVPKLGELLQFVINLLNEQINQIIKTDPNSPQNEIRTIQTDLVRMRTLLYKFDIENLNAHEGIKLMQSMHPRVFNKIQNDALLADIDIITFVDMLLQAGVNEELNLYVKTIVHTALAKIEHAITVVLWKENKINEEEYGDKLKQVENNYKKTIDDIQNQIALEKNKNKNGSLDFLFKSVVSSLISVAIGLLPKLLG